MAMAKEIEEKVLKEAKNTDLASMDEAVMIKRGLNPLTSEEKSFYNQVIEGIDLDKLQPLMPVTIMDRVFEDLEQNYPLLKEIDFVNTTGTTRWITRTSETQGAWWGELTDEIKRKLAAEFRVEDTVLFKLSAHVPIHKSMLDLGPVWLDRFVRIILAESIYIALESAIVSGSGKTEPIGMMKDLNGAVVGRRVPKQNGGGTDKP